MIIGFILVVIVMVVLLNSIINNISNDITKETDKYKIHIGETFIINNDTSTIVDYSLIDETFTLSNGKKINYLLVNKK